MTSKAILVRAVNGDIRRGKIKCIAVRRGDEDRLDFAAV